MFFKKAKYRECFEDIMEGIFSGGIMRPGFDRAMLSLNLKQSMSFLTKKE
jgi:hypothetical protein